MTSQRMNPRAMSEWIVPAASSAVSPRRSVHARVSFSPAVKNVTRSSTSNSRRTIYYGMGQMVFFTVGEDECRAWGLPRGATSVEGAGQIHTDLAKTFVRAEVVSYDDFRRVGSMKEAKTHGVYRLESKTYVVHDGDVLNIRFNV